MSEFHIYDIDTEVDLFSSPNENDPCYMYDVTVRFNPKAEGGTTLSADLRVCICNDAVIESNFVNESDCHFEERVTLVQKTRVRAMASMAALNRHDGEGYDDDDYDYEPDDDSAWADGDALASAGFGTDEDYGSYGGDDW